MKATASYPVERRVTIQRTAEILRTDIGTVDRLGYFNCASCGPSERGGSEPFRATSLSVDGERCDRCGVRFLIADGATFLSTYNAPMKKHPVMISALQPDFIIGTLDGLGYFACNECGPTKLGDSKPYRAGEMKSGLDFCDRCGQRFEMES